MQTLLYVLILFADIIIRRLVWLKCSYRILGIYMANNIESLWNNAKNVMLIWIRALLSTAAEIKTVEGREMLVGLFSPPVTESDWLLHNTASLARLVRITIVSQGYVLLGSVQFWSAWFEFTIGCFLASLLLLLEFWVWIIPRWSLYL